MDSFPVWAIWSTPAGAFVLAPVLSSSLAVAAVTIIGFLMEAGVPAAVALTAAGVSSRFWLGNSGCVRGIRSPVDPRSHGEIAPNADATIPPIGARQAALLPL
jgi:hypothetical protein